MPELPEVETVRRGLAPVMEGARFDEVVANRADLLMFEAKRVYYSSEAYERRRGVTAGS